MSIRGLISGFLADTNVDAADAFGVVANTFEFVADEQDRRQVPHVAGHGLLRGDQGERFLLDAVTFSIDRLIVGDQLP